MSILRTISSFVASKVAWLVMFVFGLLAILKFRKKGTPKVHPEEEKLKEEVHRVEVEEATTKATAKAEAEAKIIDLREAASDPDGVARRKKLADLLNK